jgi:hypothetical protein
MDDTAALVDYKIPAKELKKLAECYIYSNLDCKSRKSFWGILILTHF